MPLHQGVMVVPLLKPPVLELMFSRGFNLFELQNVTLYIQTNCVYFIHFLIEIGADYIAFL